MGSGLSVLTSLASQDLPETDSSKCSHKFCEKWGHRRYHCADCHEDVSDEKFMDDEDRIIDSIVDNSVPEDGVHRGVTIQFLIDFANACNCWTMTTRDVRRRFVMTATRTTRCRFVELPEMAKNIGRATTFVSHTWGAKFGDLVAALCDGHADRSRVVWVDIFAVRQWPSHKPDLDFSAVVRQCKSFVVVCSSLPEIESLKWFDITNRNISAIPPHIRTQIAFLRVWCLVEIHTAIISGVTIIMKGGSHQIMSAEEIIFKSDIGMLGTLTRMIDIEGAEATVAADKERILSEIRSTESSEGNGVNAVNNAVRGVLTGGIVAAKQPIVQCAACGDKFALETLLREPVRFIGAVSGCGYMDLLQKFMLNGAELNVGDADGCKPLMHAATGGHIGCVQLLVQGGAAVEDRDHHGRTALFHAVTGGHLTCAEFLLKHGADVTTKSNNGWSCLMIAGIGGHASCVELLLHQKGGTTTLNDQGPENRTALMLAAMGGQFKCVELLINAGAGLEIVDVNKMTALMLAAMAGFANCLSLLIDAGGNVNARDCANGTALKWAKQGNHKACIDLLSAHM